MIEATDAEPGQSQANPVKCNKADDKMPSQHIQHQDADDRKAGLPCACVFKAPNGKHFAHRKHGWGRTETATDLEALISNLTCLAGALCCIRCSTQIGRCVSSTSEKGS